MITKDLEKIVFNCIERKGMKETIKQIQELRLRELPEERIVDFSRRTVEENAIDMSYNQALQDVRKAIGGGE